MAYLLIFDINKIANNIRINGNKHLKRFSIISKPPPNGVFEQIISQFRYHTLIRVVDMIYYSFIDGAIHFRKQKFNQDVLVIKLSN